MTTLALIQARMGASRLPGKVLKELAGLPALGWTVRAARAIPGIDKVAVATSDNPADDPLAAWCKEQKVDCVRGPLDDVLARFAKGADQFKANIILRLTADCPFLDPQICGQVIRLLAVTGADYASNAAPPTWPDGLDCEAFTREALFAAHREATHPFDREHVTPFLTRHRLRFTNEALICPLPNLSGERWTLDEESDLRFLQTVAAKLPTDRPPSFLEVLAILDANPSWRDINRVIARNEGYYRPGQIPEPSNFSVSADLLKRAEKRIPLGSQTFSKSRVQWPAGYAPLFATHGEGGRVFDADGNEYVDLVCGLLPVVLGYADPDVDAAIRKQLTRGISFSLATTLEAELAERMARLIPCAEKIRFAKNGSDATAAAIRLARAYTNREHVLACGYHGWQDWYIGSTTRNKGVPKVVRALTHTVPYNDLNAVQQMLETHDIAAMIMEPMNVEEPNPGYLASLKELLHKHGALLIFDEVITGFRYHIGGAQSLFGVTPDLAAFGKAMANGMPISAITGRTEVMDEMEEIFFSGTFGGEALSLAAAIATIDKMEREPVIDMLWKTGQAISDGVESRIKAHGLDKILELKGKAPWKILMKNPPANLPGGPDAQAMQTLFVTQMARHGVLNAGCHNICYAHSATDVAHVLAAYESVLKLTAEALNSGDFSRYLPCPPLQPIFKVR